MHIICLLTWNKWLVEMTISFIYIYIYTWVQVPLLVLAVDHVADALSHYPLPPLFWPHSLWLPAALLLSHLQAACHIFPSESVTVAVAPQQKVAGLDCHLDTGKPVAKEGAALPAGHKVAGCSLSDVLLQGDPRGDLDWQDLGSYEGGGYLGIPKGRVKGSFKSVVKLFV